MNNCDNYSSYRACKQPHNDAAKNETTFRGGVSDVEATTTDLGVNLGQGGRVVDTLKHGFLSSRNFDLLQSF